MRRVLVDEPDTQRLFWQSIAAGGLVVYPTDTLYGIGADATNHSAVERIAALKEKPGPFSAIIGDITQLQEYALVPDEITIKLEGMLPGPYTILLPPRFPESLSTLVLSEEGKVGFRIPNHPFVQSVCRAGTTPVISTSVNRTTQKPLQDPDEIEDQFSDYIDLLVDDGKLAPSQGSTVLDTTREPWRILRQGDGKL
jgi:tRNA threonylcarbamoyl adenosine modification protein (Sua5/YciO/YrdC/YwlC family)